MSEPKCTCQYEEWVRSSGDIQRDRTDDPNCPAHHPLLLPPLTDELVEEMANRIRAADDENYSHTQIGYRQLARACYAVLERKARQK